MALNFETEITFLENIPSIGRYLGTVLRGFQNGVNNLGQNLGAEPAGTIPAAPQIQGLTVKANNGGVHAVIADNNAISKHVNYFVEYDTNPAFTQPHVEHLGASRSRMLNLPGKTDSGATQQFYFRAYSQYLGGNPGKPVHFGGTTPTPVSPGGNVQMTLIPSTGSGTAQPNGQQGGSGFGKVLFRPSQVRPAP